MVAVLHELGLTELACSIEGLSPVGAAAILAQTGDLRRFTSARAVVKHAGLAPRERLSGTFTGKARLTGAGRPGLRLAAWRATWAALQNNRVYAARYRHLTTRRGQQAHPDPGPERDRRGAAAPVARRRGQRTGLGPRHRRRRHPNHAGGGCGVTRFARPALRVHKLGRGEPSAASRTTGISPIITGRPGSSSTQPDHTLSSTAPLPLCRDRRRARGPNPSR